MPDLADALTRFNVWRASLGEPGVVDEDSGLTTQDLDVIGEHLAATADVVLIEQASLDDLVRRGRSEGSAPQPSE